MDRIVAEQKRLEIDQAYIKGEITRKEAYEAYRNLNTEIQKSKKMDKQEKKELAHKILKIILEVLLQIITLGLPTLLNGGKSIIKHK